MKRENYRRYGGKGPKRIREPKWVKDLPKNDADWTIEQDMKYWQWSSIYARRGYSQQEWKEIHMERKRIKREEFTLLADELSDYNGEDILRALKKQLEWQADYFENFGHCQSNQYKASQMRLCCRLIDIICWGGLTKDYTRSFRKYVNIRNADRFKDVPKWDRAYLFAEAQELRYKKAYSLLFKILYRNVMKWWD